MKNFAFDKRNLSPAQLMGLQPEEKQREFFEKFTPRELDLLKYKWRGWLARPTWQDEKGFYHGQLPPDKDWLIWMYMAGRGTGKTRTGAEWIKHRVENEGARNIIIVARTAQDYRDVIINGPSGLRSTYPPELWGKTVIYEPSNSRVVWPNRAIALLRSAEKPDSLRGSQADTIWADEIAAYPRLPDIYTQLIFNLRLGSNPRALFTTTPKPLRKMQEIIDSDSTVVTRGSSYENFSNLSPAFIQAIINEYAGTRVGRQEIDGEMMMDNPNALWTYESISDHRHFDLSQESIAELMSKARRVVIGVDPAMSSGVTGIVVAMRSNDNHYYILEDASTDGKPVEWVTTIKRLFFKYAADAVIAEGNQGRELVVTVLQGFGIQLPVHLENARQGKYLRAEPISLLYERGLVHHVGEFVHLEEQMTSFSAEMEGKMKLDRLDALVWALNNLAELGSNVNQTPILVMGKARWQQNNRGYAQPRNVTS